MKHIIIGTAGHIDHGKTALIKALTGIDADRLKEEKQRGITIDIGFAFLSLSDHIEAGIIDVPGHEKFVKNMLAGIGGIDLAILVIAADEGIMPQTEEHLAICDLLQIQHGLVALTKIDLVDEEWLEMVTEDIGDGLTGTFLEEAPIIPVSSKTGDGLDTLRQELAILAENVRERSSNGMLRLPIDRVFTIKGFGTVVTGTLISGTVEVEDIVEILPNAVNSRIRNIQVHDIPVERAYAGQRTALNLHGLEKQAIQRGCVLCEPNLLKPTYMLDAYLKLTPKASRPLKHRSRIRFHHGTSEIMARVMLFDREELLPGEQTFAQFRLETPLVAMGRDRYIIRSYSPIITIGGGEIADVHPQKHKRSFRIIPRLDTLKNGSLKEVIELYVEDAQFQPLSPKTLSGMVAVETSRIQQGVEQLIQQGQIINTSKQEIAVIHRTHYQGLVTRILEILEQFHTQCPLKIGMQKEELRKKLPPELAASIFQQVLDEQMAAGTIQVEQNRVRKSTYHLRLTPQQQHIQHTLEEVYLSSSFQPPGRKDALQKSGIPEKEGMELFNLLVDTGVLVRIEEDIYYHQTILKEMTHTIIEYLKRHHEISVGDVKNLFQTSRKYTVPMLAYWDAENITVRKGDIRVLRNNQ